jgi:hypothetical protein
LDNSSSHSSKGHALSTSIFLSMHQILVLQMSGFLIQELLIIWLRIKPFFLLLINVTPNKYFFGDDRSLGVVGSIMVQLVDGHFNDVLCVPSLSCNLLYVYQITHSGEGKTMEFSPHQVVINNLKDP